MITFVGRVEVDDDQSGYPMERSEVANARVVEVDDEQSGDLEKIRLLIMNSFRTRTTWLCLLEQNEDANVHNVHVVVDDNVVGRAVVDDDQSGFPETFSILDLGSSYCIQRKNFTIE